jgi:hypothetical protein
MDRRTGTESPSAPIVRFGWLDTGPWACEQVSDEELRAAWAADRDEIMRSYLAGDRLTARAGRRPWPFWRFDLGEDQPEGDDEPIRLAELGLLSSEELAVLKRWADEARPRIGTEREQKGTREHPFWPNRRAVALWDAIERAALPS